MLGPAQRVIALDSTPSKALIDMEFEWDQAKANARRHLGVTFEEAKTVFDDESSITIVREYFPDAESVNHALRSLIALLPTHKAAMPQRRKVNVDAATSGEQRSQARR
jgi:hypothetical protein